MQREARGGRLWWRAGERQPSMRARPASHSHAPAMPRGFRTIRRARRSRSLPLILCSLIGAGAFAALTDGGQTARGAKPLAEQIELAARPSRLRYQRGLADRPSLHRRLRSLRRTRSGECGLAPALRSAQGARPHRAPVLGRDGSRHARLPRSAPYRHQGAPPVRRVDQRRPRGPGRCLGPPARLRDAGCGKRPAAYSWRRGSGRRRRAVRCAAAASGHRATAGNRRPHRRTALDAPARVQRCGAAPG